MKSEDFIVPAHGTRIIWCDGRESKNQLHAPFKLENAEGACVSIQAEDGSWADCLVYMKQGRWQTYGRYPDGGNMVAILNQPTIDKANKIGMVDYLALTASWNDQDVIEPIPASSTTSKLIAVQYFNLAGQIISGKAKGIIIRKEIFEDGSTRITKLSNPESD